VAYEKEDRCEKDASHEGVLEGAADSSSSTSKGSGKRGGGGEVSHCAETASGSGGVVRRSHGKGIKKEKFGIPSEAEGKEGGTMCGERDYRYPQTHGRQRQYFL